MDSKTSEIVKRADISIEKIKKLIKARKNATSKNPIRIIESSDTNARSQL
jgi:hypothetical protein